MMTTKPVNNDDLLNTNSFRTVSVIGAGLVGCLASIYFAQAGSEVHVYEQRKDIRTTPHSRERSINMALSYRGMLALKNANFNIQTLLPCMVPMEGRMIHKVDGSLESQPYGLSGECIYSIDRRKLIEALLMEAEKLPGVTFHFEHDLKEVDWDQMKCRFFDKKSKSYVTVKQTLIVGADGAHSIVRHEMIRPSRMNFHLEYLDHAYLELPMPSLGIQSKGTRPTFPMDPTHLHIWPRHAFMLIALPNPDGSFTCTFFAPWSIFESFTNDTAILDFFRTHFSDALPLLTDSVLLRAFHQNPVGPLIHLSCSHFHYLNKAILLGDAAHAMVPFFGQGMNCGFEDLTVLFPSNTPQEFDDLSHYSAVRHRDIQAISDMALQNYVEMRSLVVSPWFKLRTLLIRTWARWVPGFLPLYSLVSFTNVPYHVCQKRGQQQKQLSSFALSLLGFSTLSLLGWGLHRTSPLWRASMSQLFIKS